jgi:guanylate kinase
LKARWPERTVAVFVLPPSLEELERRLRTRSTDPDDAIRRRLAVARAEIARGLAQSDYVIVNDALDAALAQLQAVVAHERARLAGGRDERAAAVAEPLRRGQLDARPWLGA